MAVKEKAEALFQDPVFKKHREKVESYFAGIFTEMVYQNEQDDPDEPGKRFLGLLESCKTEEEMDLISRTTKALFDMDLNEILDACASDVEFEQAEPWHNPKHAQDEEEVEL